MLLLDEDEDEDEEVEENRKKMVNVVVQADSKKVVDELGRSPLKKGLIKPVKEDERLKQGEEAKKKKKKKKESEESKKDVTRRATRSTN